MRYLIQVNVISEMLSSKTIHEYEIKDAFEDEDAFLCDINEGLRLINFTRPMFKELSNTIYRDNVTTQISSPSLTLSVDDVKKLYNYFESYFAEIYSQLFSDRIVPIIQKSSVNMTLRGLMALKQFVPVLFTGPCVINPFLDCGRFSKVFRETLFYSKSMNNIFALKDNTVCLLTNREICECLGLDKYINFTPSQLVLVLLGIFNPYKYPSTQTHKFINGNSVYRSVEEMVEKGLNPSTARRVSSLYALCLSHAFSLGIRENKVLNTYIDIISKASLV